MFRFFEISFQFRFNAIENIFTHTVRVALGVCLFSPEKSEISRTFPGSWNTEARGLKLMGIIAMPKNKKT